MISAGNDIVALNVIDIQRTQSPAFYAKFITPTEFELYNPNEITLINFVWLLWSAKESAYKYLKRINSELIFAPIKIKVVSLDIVVSLIFFVIFFTKRVSLFFVKKMIKN